MKIGGNPAERNTGIDPASLPAMAGNVVAIEGNIMSKRHSAKYKLDRRMGENIWGRPKSPVNKREYGPGQHGQRRKGKVSDFGIQLRAKQKLKGYYGDVTEKQFKRTYAEASRMKGDTSQNLIGLLEQRLDMVVYRAKFAPTIFAARQVVSHGLRLAAALGDLEQGGRVTLSDQRHRWAGQSGQRVSSVGNAGSR